VAIDNFLADRQPDSRSRVIRSAVQTLEHHEDAIEVLAVDAYPVIFDSKCPDVGLLVHTDVDAWRFGALEL